MKLTTGILAVAIATTTMTTAGAAWAQNPDAIDNARSMAKSLQQKQANDTNAALNAAGVPAKPATAQAAPPMKPAGPMPAVQANKVAVKPAMAMTPKMGPANHPFAARAMGRGIRAPQPGAEAWHQQAAKQNLPAVLALPTTEPVPVLASASAADAFKQAKADDKSDKSDKKSDDKKWAMSGKRDPFFSPVVQQSSGSGCATGKKCLEIGQINLRGVVKSDAGFIAVVTNNLNKAYFLRENDPVFNGYVVKITGDSVVFQETVQDKLGKAFTREVTKRIFTPAV